FGPGWSWIPFNGFFGILTLITLIAGPSRIASETPSAAQWTSSTFSLTMFLAIAIGIGLIFKERYLELISCAIVFILSGLIWPKFRTFGPL
ncbi:MAG: hypothetical protein WAL93_03605, partial [Desulfobacterales bacterium]